SREDMAGGGSQSTRHQGQDRWAQKNARNHIDVLRRSIWLRLPGRGIAFPGSLPGGTRWAIGLRKSVRILIFAASVGIVLAGIMGLLP
uniref:hypothetical protein n=1 Tax=Mesorhizobium sp. M2D.F.Ca.ET.225.01.1.1 TaxID=2563942 RepID=UPI001AEE8119